MPSIYMANAIQAALAEAMAEDPSVIVLGEDVELSTIGATKGLIDKFGANRVRNSPISEATVVGSCVGAAACGLRPVMDLMFSSFLYIALDQVANQAARLRYMSGGQVSLPLVLFAGTGPSGSAAAQHSENPHPLLMSLSGVKVVFPSTPADAKGLLLASIRDPDPVVFLLDLMLAGSRGEVPDGAEAIPLGEGVIRRPGTDLTVVAIGSAVPQALTAATELAHAGVSAEVIDPRTLVPCDWPLIFDSVRRTGRLVIADPARRTCGAAAEIAARAMESCWSSLRTAPVRVSWEDVPIPFSPVLEQAVTVSSAKIRAAAAAMLGAS
ncbi:MAG TPA: transketolase C-terminal domain-containing protein [Streptosporangiaceae bacterium]|nr:transketolase C-terminal domain-containing protein [Streptosporangiaceae bacterium]